MLIACVIVFCGIVAVSTVICTMVMRMRRWNTNFEKEQKEFAEMRLRMLETEAQRKAEKLAIHRTEQAWEGYQEAQRAMEIMEELEGNHNDR
jgi:hypothetical protein